MAWQARHGHFIAQMSVNMVSLPRPNQARLFIPSLRLPRFRDRRQGRDGRGRQDHARTAHLSENVCVRFEEKHLAKS